MPPAMRGQGVDRGVVAICSVLATIAVLGCTGCFSTNISTMAESEAAVGDDESALWRQSDTMAAALRSHGYLVEEERFAAYLEQISDRLLAADLSTLDETVRVHLARDPALNAMALPNGDIYVMTGLVAQLRTESELAALLGHEIGHIVDRHSLRSYRHARNKLTAANAVVFTLGMGAGAVGGQAAGSVIAGMAGAAGEFWTNVLIAGYSQDFEYAADATGVHMLAATGYDPAASIELFERLLENQKPSATNERPWHSTHPKLRDRIEHARATIDSLESSPVVRTDDETSFAQLVARAHVENARIALAHGDYEETERCLDESAAAGATTRTEAHAAYLRGEVARRRDGEQGFSEATAAYRNAVRLDPAFADAYRELGMLQRSSGRPHDAALALQSYVDLRPDAPDRQLIESYIAVLRR